MTSRARAVAGEIRRTVAKIDNKVFMVSRLPCFG
jgi:hypothetical protein